MPKPFEEIFSRARPVIAMIHTGPTPGLPEFVCVKSAVERAVAEAALFAEHGVDGIIIENMWDFPCVHERKMGPEVTAFMTRIAHCVKRQVPHLPVGIQVLFQANRTALAVALAAECEFIRAEGWTYAHISDKGVAEACAGEVYRYRHAIGAGHIPIYADVKKKHASHAWTGDLTIADVAHTLQLHRADGVVVTGAATGVPPLARDLDAVREETSLPVLVGSGVTEDNVAEFMQHADGLIVGTAFKENGHWQSPVCEKRIVRVMETVNHVRREILSGKEEEVSV